MPKDRKLQEPWANDPRNVPPAERRLQGRATSRTSRCECDLRHRQWNPHTGRCETCRCTYVDPDPHGIPPNSSIDAMEES